MTKVIVFISMSAFLQKRLVVSILQKHLDFCDSVIWFLDLIDLIKKTRHFQVIYKTTYTLCYFPEQQTKCAVIECIVIFYVIGQNVDLQI